MDTSREKEREMNKITQVARGPCPVATRAAAQGTSHGPSPAAAMEDCPAVAFGRWRRAQKCAPLRLGEKRIEEGERLQPVSPSGEVSRCVWP